MGREEEEEKEEKEEKEKAVERGGAKMRSYVDDIWPLGSPDL